MSARPIPIKQMAIPSSPEALQEVVDAVEAVAAEVGMPRDTAEELAIALTEAVNNAIYHGNGGAPEKPVQIRFEREGEALRIRVLDQGEGFDLEAVPDPLAEENLLKPSGRGLLVMRAMVDEVRHHFSDAGTEVVLLKRIR